jgi:hypothetical protein
MDENSSAGISGNVRIRADGEIKVEALNSIFDITIGGAGVLQTGSGSNTGIAGGIAANMLDGSTVAYIQPRLDPDHPIANQITYGSLNIKAERTGNIIAVAAGGAVGVSGKGAEVAGGVTVNILNDDTYTRIQDASLQKRPGDFGDITAKASNSAGMYSLAGGIAIGGNVGVGASVAVNIQPQRQRPPYNVP